MRDEVRLLGRKGGYTKDPARALPDEPEAVSRTDQERITLQAARTWPHLTALNQGARAAAPLHVRLQRAKAQARALRVDVHAELRLVRLALEGGRSYAHVERRLVALEARVWPDRQ